MICSQCRSSPTIRVPVHYPARLRSERRLTGTPAGRPQRVWPPPSKFQLRAYTTPDPASCCRISRPISTHGGRPGGPLRVRKYADRMAAMGLPHLDSEQTFGGHANDADPELNARRWARHYVYLAEKLMD